MEYKKKTIITVETRQRIVLTRRQTKTVRCEHCAAEVELLSPAQPAHISNIELQAIVQLIECGELQFIKTPEAD